jgi:ubiquinone/menaquinone biosynthesis C-methylase UbiE
VNPYFWISEPLSLHRVPEPKILSPLDEAQAYESMDHTTVNRQFVDDLLECDQAVGPRVVDLGCGPAAIPIELCGRVDTVDVLAIDSEIEMLEIAKREIDIAGMLDRITLHHCDASAMQEYEQGIADTVISNSMLHHLDEPQRGLQSAIRLLRRGGRIFIRDLSRPSSLEEIETLVSLHAGDEDEVAQQLFRQSLHAALTLDEIRELAGGFGISPTNVQMTSDRHWTIDWCSQH